MREFRDTLYTTGTYLSHQDRPLHNYMSSFYATNISSEIEPPKVYSSLGIFAERMYSMIDGNGFQIIFIVHYLDNNDDVNGDLEQCAGSGLPPHQLRLKIKRHGCHAAPQK